MTFARDATELVGNTPLLRLGRLCPHHQIYAKCEFMNPVSVKDRPVLRIIEDAERAGLIKAGDTLIECTSGNTGMAVAWIASIKGYKAMLVMSEIQSVERRAVMKALGAELVLTPEATGTIGARARMHEILEEHPEYFYISQHQNPSNPAAHEATTGPELWADTGGEIDIFVAGLGTGGTVCGTSRFLKSKKRTVQIVGVEPTEAPFISKGEWQPHRIMGTSPGFLPEILDRGMIDEIFLVSEEEAFETCRQIARLEGLLVGVSSGATAHAAREIAKRTGNEGKVIACVFADTGQRYLSVEDLFPR